MRATTIARSLAILAVCLGAAFIVSTADTAWAQHDAHADPDNQQHQQTDDHGQAYPADGTDHDPADTKNPHPETSTSEHAADARRRPAPV